MGQLLRYTLKIPERKPGQTHFEYMCVDFVDAVRKCLKDGGYAEIDKNREEGGQFIVAYQGRLYRVETDFQVGMHVEPYIACGSGEQYAMGALAATQNIRGMTPTVRIRNALNIAARFCASVRPPHKVIRLLRR
jgi:ATP-dependent protease HslVU (ClpYQ) peptidase subunit